MSTSAIQKTIHELKVVTQSASFAANSGNVSVTAQVPSGYKFLCWIRAASVGWVGLAYPATNDPTATFWTPTVSAAERKIDCSFIAYK